MTTARRATARRAIAVVVFTVAAVAGADSAPAASSAFAARSDRGVVAYGVVYDDREEQHRQFEVQFVVPQGSTVTTGPVLPTGVDLSRPWVSVAAKGGSRTCSTLANPAQFSAGGQKGDRWTGLYVDVACDDDTGYGFYRFTWTAELWLVSNPLITATTGGQPVPFSTDVAQGVITAWPEQEQMGGITLCGFRHGRAPDCFARGQGMMLLSTAGVVTAGTVL